MLIRVMSIRIFSDSLYRKLHISHGRVIFKFRGVQIKTDYPISTSLVNW